MKQEGKDLSNNELFHSLGVLLLMGVPQGLEFGIDNISWKIGVKFKGLKMIPLGPHLISYTLKSEDNMFKINRFLNFTSDRRIQVYRWNEEYSYFAEMNGQEAQGYKSGVRQFHFDSNLGPYPNQTIQFWKNNTKFISKEVLNKLDPIDRIHKFHDQYHKKQQNVPNQAQDIQFINHSQTEENIHQPDQENQQPNDQQVNGKFKNLIDTIYYSEIYRKMNRTPQEVSLMGLDKTQILKEMLKREWKNKYQNLLGELQYSFIYFIIGEDEESLNQWKKLIHLISFSQKAFEQTILEEKSANLEALASDFIAVFYEQFEQFPIDFFIDELSKNNFTCDCLSRLSEYLSNKLISKKIKRRIEKLLEMIQAKFNFNVKEQQKAEDQPIIVDENDSYF